MHFMEYHFAGFCYFFLNKKKIFFFLIDLKSINYVLKTAFFVTLNVLEHRVFLIVGNRWQIAKITPFFPLK